MKVKKFISIVMSVICVCSLSLSVSAETVKQDKDSLSSRSVTSVWSESEKRMICEKYDITDMNESISYIEHANTVINGYWKYKDDAMHVTVIAYKYDGTYEVLVNDKATIALHTYLGKYDDNLFVFADGVYTATKAWAISDDGEIIDIAKKVKKENSYLTWNSKTLCMKLDDESVYSVYYDRYSKSFNIFEKFEIDRDKFLKQDVERVLIDYYIADDARVYVRANGTANIVTKNKDGIFDVISVKYKDGKIAKIDDNVLPDLIIPDKDGNIL